MNPKDLPEIPAPLTVTREVARLSAEIAEELGMIQCEKCERYYTPDLMMRPGTRFRGECNVYLMHPTCRACHEDELHNN